MNNVYPMDADRHADDVLISRLIDGDLTTDERADLEARVTADPELAARVAKYEHNDRLLRVLQDAEDVTIPHEIVQSLQANSVTNTDRVVQFPRRTLYAAAASVCLAVMVGLQVHQHDTPVVGTAQDALLSAALDELPSDPEHWSTLEDGRRLQAILTFPAAEGTWCREFAVASEEDHWRGVSCRHSGSWVTQVIARDHMVAPSADYRPAGSGDNDAIASFVTATATDIPLSRREETALIAARWSTDPND